MFQDIIVNKAIKMFFSLNTNVNLNKKFIRRRTQQRHRSSNKIFISKAEIKHSNDKVIITLYTYNKTKKFFANTLSKLYRKVFAYIPTSRKMLKNVIPKLFVNNLIRSNISNKFKIYKNEYKKQIKHKDYKKLFIYKYFYNLYRNMLINKTSNYLMYSKYKTISKIGLILYKKFIFRSRYIYNILKNKNLYNIIKLNKRRKLNSLYIKNLDKYKNEYYNSFLKETLKKEMLYLKYNQLLMTDSYKFSNIYLSRLGNILSKIYNKKIEFNIINLKYIHMDTHIFSEIISLKIRNRKNNLLRIIKRSLALQKINKSKKYKYKIGDAYVNRYNLIDKHDTSLLSKDVLDDILNKIFTISLVRTSNKNLINSLEKEMYIYRSIKFRKIRGVRLEAKGRLTKRLTASKSIFKIRYIGSLRNIDSINSFPCTLLRGYLNSNIDYVNLNSKTRNGSFGLKG